MPRDGSPPWNAGIGGGLVLRWNGYIRVTRNGPDRDKYEHRVVWERRRGPIPAGFQIHHRNGRPWDNRLRNLELIEKSAHASKSARDRHNGRVKIPIEEMSREDYDRLTRRGVRIPASLRISILGEEESPDVPF